VRRRAVPRGAETVEIAFNKFRSCIICSGNTPLLYVGTGMFGQLNLHEPSAPEQVDPSRDKRGLPDFIAQRWLGAKRKRSLPTYQRRNRYTR
jgi:hypothetical protein